MIQLKDHLDYIEQVRHILFDGDISDLLSYTNFSMCVFLNDCTVKKIVNSRRKIIKHVFDHAIYLDVELDNIFMPRLLHYNMGLDMLSYIFYKYNVNLEVSNVFYKLIHIVCIKGDLPMLKFLANNNVCLISRDYQGKTPLDLLKERQVDKSDASDMIEYLEKLIH